MQAQSPTVRRTINLVGHKLTGMPDDPPPSTATAAAPTVLVPDEDQRWSFEFKNAPHGDDELDLAELQEAVGATYPEPAVVNEETVLLSPPSGKSNVGPSRSPSSADSTRHSTVQIPEMYLVRAEP